MQRRLPGTRLAFLVVLLGGGCQGGRETDTLDSGAARDARSETDAVIPPGADGGVADTGGGIADTGGGIADTGMGIDGEADVPSTCIMNGATPSEDWTFHVGDRTLVSNTANVPAHIWNWQPDGHISVLPDGEGGYMMYWALSVAWRTRGDGPYPEDMIRSDPDHAVFGGQRDELAWDNGGSWLMSVLPLPDGRLVGFYHAEDHWYPPMNPDNVAWKSIGVTYSTDNGRSWDSGTQIITAHLSKPDRPEWGGAGDNSAVWDCQNNRFLMYYSERVDDFRISAAATHDQSGLGGWQKWNGAAFDSPGNGGASAPLPGLAEQPGANPSVQWNTHLEKWVMVWHGWNGNIYLASSNDGVSWDPPRLVTGAQAGRARAWYPTLIGAPLGDSAGGQVVRLYYADIASDVSERDFVYRTLTFSRND